MLKFINRTTQPFTGVVWLLLFCSIPSVANESEAAANRFGEIRDDPLKLRPISDHHGSIGRKVTQRLLQTQKWTSLRIFQN